MKAAYNRRVEKLEALARERRKAYENKPHTFRLIYADGTEETSRNNLYVNQQYIDGFMYLMGLAEDGKLEEIPWGDLLVMIEDLTDGTVDDLKQSVLEAIEHSKTETEEEREQFWDDLFKDIEV